MAQADRITAAVQRIAAEFKSIRANEMGGVRQQKLTKSQYAALTNRDGKITYIISDWGTTTTPPSGGTAQSATLLPSAAGSITTGWANEGAPTYDKLASNDGGTSAIYSPTTNDTVSYQMTDLPGGASTVTSVTVVLSVLKLDPVTATTRPIVVIGGTVYEGTDVSPSAAGTYETLSYTWTNNPATNAAWTVAAVNAMEVGIRKTNNAGERCSYIAATVAYT